MLNKNDIVSIDFKFLPELPESILTDLNKWDEELNNRHKITNIFINKAYLPNKNTRYELDNEYVFYENELNKINNNGAD